MRATRFRCGRGAIRLLLTCCLAAGFSQGVGAEAFARDALAAADYFAGKRTFTQRCGACHTLADEGAEPGRPESLRTFLARHRRG